MTFKYALLNRPASIGAVPKVCFDLLPRPTEGKPHHYMARHGIMVTQVELTIEQVKAFELAPLIDSEQIDWLAEKISDTMFMYADGYIEMSTKKPTLFYDIVMDRSKIVGQGVYYSIADPDMLFARVIELLQC